MEPDPNYPLSRCKAKKNKKHTPQTFFVDEYKISVNNIKLAFGAKLDLDYDEKWSQ